MSRRKSFKKSLRESFRRLRKGRSQRGKRDKTPTRTEETKPSPSKEQVTDLDATGDVSSPNVAVTSPPTDAKPVERQVEARSAEDSMTSMVRCLYLDQSYIINSAVTTPTLWAGTNAGAIYVFTITRPSNEKRESDSITCQLGKEIQLKHRAPVIAIQILDGLGRPLPDPLDDKKEKGKGAEITNHKVLICSEEQFKFFTLPGLKPGPKYKLTGLEGARVRKVGVLNFQNKSDETYSEYCLVCFSNQGDIGIFSVPELKKQQNHPCLKREDINGISSVVFTKYGQGFYLHSPCEFRRFTLSAQSITEPLFSLELAKGARPPPPSPVKEMEIVEKEESPKKEKVKEAENVDEVKETPAEEKIEDKEKNDISSEKIDPNTSNMSQDEEKRDLDITVDSVKDHLSSLTTEESTTVIENETSTKIVKTMETVTKLSTMAVTVKETMVNSTTAE